MQYKIEAPQGNIVPPKQFLTEKELRTFIPQLVQDADQVETWKEKAEHDDIDDLIGWLEQAGYKITQVEK